MSGSCKTGLKSRENLKIHALMKKFYLLTLLFEVIMH